MERRQQEGKSVNGNDSKESEEGSNVQEIERILKLSKARKTIVRDCYSTHQGSDQVLYFVLKKTISRRLDRLSLTPNQVSVITSTGNASRRLVTSNLWNLRIHPQVL